MDITAENMGTIEFTALVEVPLTLTVDTDHPLGWLLSTLSREGLREVAESVARNSILPAIKAGLPALNQGESWAHLELRQED